tara:strand:+ start:312 stop:431 length:120 start_codon:yes stop_codon:yes gene_type:complete
MGEKQDNLVVLVVVALVTIARRSLEVPEQQDKVLQVALE